MRAALRLVTTTGLRHLAAHRTRLALSVVGIAAGVALAVAVSALGSSIDASLRGIADAAASRANLEVRPESAVGLLPEVYTDVRSVDGVTAAGATVEAQAILRSDARELQTLVIGFDQGILDLAPRALDPAAVQAADPFGLFLPASVARDLEVGVGDAIEVATPEGWRTVGVGGILPEDLVGRSRVVTGVIGVVQPLLGKEGRVDAIYVYAEDPDVVLPRLQAVVDGVGRAGPVALRQDDLREILASTTAALNVATIVALFVGAFLVYNTMAMAAVERVREAALMRAVGARRRQIFALFLADGAVLGALGSALGIIGGVVLARVLLVRRGALLEEIFPIDISRLVLEPVALTLAGIAGVVAAVAAAYLPARRVAHADPAPALGPAGTLEDPTLRSRRATVIVGCLLVPSGFALALTDVWGRGEVTGSALAGMTLVLAGVALLVPTLIPLIAAPVLGRLTGRRTPGIVRLAAGEVLRSPGRTAFTAGAVLLALSLIVGFSIAMGSFTRNFQAGMDRILRADLFVRSPTWRPFGSDVPVAAAVGEEILEVPGVVTVYPFRITTGRLDDDLVILQSLDFDGYARLPAHDPDFRAEMRTLGSALRRPDAVAISASVTTRMGIEVGETVTMTTPTGRRHFRIVGTFPDPAAVNPTFVFDYATFSQAWGTQTADSFGIGVDPAADVGAVRAELERRLRPAYGVDVEHRREFVDRVNSFVLSIQGLIGSVQLVAVIVAGLGLANTLLISTLERRRDLGALRAIGMLRRQVRRMVTVEAMLVGGLGVVLAWGLGTAIGIFILGYMQAESGIRMDVVFPATAYVIPAFLGIGGAVLAALYPAHRASRVDIVDALQYE